MTETPTSAERTAWALRLAQNLIEQGAADRQALMEHWQEPKLPPPAEAEPEEEVSSS